MKAGHCISKLLEPTIRVTGGFLPRSAVPPKVSRRAFSAYRLSCDSQNPLPLARPRATAPFVATKFSRPASGSFRFNSSSATGSRPLTDRSDKPESEPTPRDVPAYELTFTCRPCLTRSKHRVSKQGYHNGTVLITCPNCKNRHIISDHLKIFSDKSTTVEQILAEKGESIKKGVLGENGDVEFWEDGSSTEREASDPVAPDKPAQLGDSKT